MLQVSLPIIAACLALAASEPASRPAALQATVDPRIELMAIIFRLAGNPEYNWPRSQSAYATEVDEYFGKFKDHPAVQMARKLRETRDISYNAPMSLAVYLSDTQELIVRVPFERLNSGLDSRWRPDDAREFVAQARRFVADTHFSEFFKAHASLYAAGAGQMTQQINKSRCVEWFNSFFGPRAEVGFHVVVAMLIGGDGYGASLLFPDGHEEVYSILGVSKFDDQGIPIIPDISGGLVHEFCHSFTNRLVDKYSDRLASAGKKLFPHRQEIMKKQAYGDWQTLMCESMVRACTIRYVLAVKGKAEADNAALYSQKRGFSWAGDLAKCFQEYEDHRDRYPTLDVFMPKVVEFFNDYVPKFEAQVAKETKEAAKAPKVDAKAPRAVSMTPANGATDVDPALTEIKITFDRPMRGISVVRDDLELPEIAGEAHYDKEGRVFTIPVRLKPNREYGFWLNKGNFDNTRSRDGVKLEPVAVTFRTRTGPTSTQAAPESNPDRKIGSSEQKADLDFLFKTIEEVHPNMYAYVSKEEFAKHRDALYARIDRPMTAIEFYKLVAPVVAKVKNGHTHVLPVGVDGFMEYVENGGKVFPLRISWDGQKAVVLESHGPTTEVPRGATILRIGHEPAQSVLDRIRHRFASEYKDYNSVLLEHKDFLPLLIWMEYGKIDSLPLRVRGPDGREADYDLKFITPTQLKESQARDTTGQSDFSFRVLEDGNAGLLEFNSFRDLASFRPFLKKTFKQMRNQHVRNLIIDLRKNPGGNNSLGDALLDYLTDKPVQQFSEAWIKISPQLRQKNPGLVEGLPKAVHTEPVDGTVVKLKGSDLPTQPVEPNAFRYSGRTFVLIGPMTASSAVGFANAVKAYGIGTLIGEEAGDPTAMYGDSLRFKLPSSRIDLEVACKYFALPGASPDERHNLLPDREVKRRPEDIARGVDTVLEYTLKLIRDVQGSSSTRPASQASAPVR